MFMKSQYLRFVGRKGAGHREASSEPALKTKDLACIHPFVWECLDLQVSKQQNPHTFTTACFSTCQD